VRNLSTQQGCRRTFVTKAQSKGNVQTEATDDNGMVPLRHARDGGGPIAVHSVDIILCSLVVDIRMSNEDFLKMYSKKILQMREQF
jgi:hypothetical protein